MKRHWTVVIALFALSAGYAADVAGQNDPAAQSQVCVTGEVAKPQCVLIGGETTVADVIKQAGGVSSYLALLQYRINRIRREGSHTTSCLADAKTALHARDLLIVTAPLSPPPRGKIIRSSEPPRPCAE